MNNLNKENMFLFAIQYITKLPIIEFRPVLDFFGGVYNVLQNLIY